LFRVRDSSTRIIQFDGALLASSSSRENRSQRWIEFNLYKTIGGSYVIAREGVSKIYHGHGCDVITRNSLVDAPRSSLAPDMVPCRLCRPDLSNMPMIYPERSRYWAQVCDSPRSVVESLYRRDETGAHYLTIVAEELLAAAARVDTGIADAFLVETID
jgi:hypothetical protein